MKLGPFEWTYLYTDHPTHRDYYLRRIAIGKLRWHKFYRGDNEDHCHDHPRNFWTFPITSYYEVVHVIPTGVEYLRVVKSWRWHYRPATYSHRVIGRTDLKSKPFHTIGWWDRDQSRPWGFWIDQSCWLPWKDYIKNNERHCD